MKVKRGSGAADSNILISQSGMHSVPFWTFTHCHFSAVTGTNVNHVFEQLARLVYARASFSYPARDAQVQKSKCLCT